MKKFLFLVLILLAYRSSAASFFDITKAAGKPEVGICMPADASGNYVTPTSGVDLLAAITATASTTSRFAFAVLTYPAATGLTFSASASICIYNKGTTKLDFIFGSSALSLSTTVCDQIPAGQVMCFSAKLGTFSALDRVINTWPDSSETVPSIGELRY